MDNQRKRSTRRWRGRGEYEETEHTQHNKKKSNTYLVADFSNIEKEKKCLTWTDKRKKTAQLLRPHEITYQDEMRALFFGVAKKKSVGMKERKKWVEQFNKSRRYKSREDNETRDRAHRAIDLISHFQFILYFCNTQLIDDFLPRWRKFVSAWTNVSCKM